MNHDKLTKRQRQIYDFIIEKKRQVGYPPSVREIGAAVGLSSSSTVHSHLTALEKKGVIRRDPAKPRALEIMNDQAFDGQNSSSSVTLPLVGDIAAGQPLLAEENIEDYLSVPKDIADNGSFLLKVKGDSMIEAGILDGDVVVIKKQVVADNGDIVAALIDDEATLKRFYKEGDAVRLQPENSSMDPIYPDNVSIIGKVTGLLRLSI